MIRQLTLTDAEALRQRVHRLQKRAKQIGRATNFRRISRAWSNMQRQMGIPRGLPAPSQVTQREYDLLSPSERWDLIGENQEDCHE